MKNVRHDPYGTQAYFKRLGRVHSKHWATSDFPEKAKREQLAKDWLRSARAHINLSQKIPDGPHTRFERDVELYLDAVTSMPSYKDRKYHMDQWAAIYHGRDRQSIKPLEIRTELERWRRTLSASSVNKRRTALMSFYTRLNGKSGYNPVRDVEKYPEEEQPRAQSPRTIYRILALMRPSKTRARLRVILTTGWPHAQIKRLLPEHLDLEKAKAYVTPRRKGKGRRGGWLPLLPGAVDALKEFIQWDAFGSFSHHAMYKSFKLALGKLNAQRKARKHPPLSIRPYDLRHSFATALAHRVTDERALQSLMMHSSATQTRRYSDAATEGRTERAIRELWPNRGASLDASRYSENRTKPVS